MSIVTKLSNAERLVVDRRRRKENQVVAAARLGVSRIAYGKMEQGLNTPKVAVGNLSKPEQCFLARRRLGLTQDQVAKSIECCPYWVRKMEAGLVDCKPLVEFYKNASIN